MKRTTVTIYVLWSAVTFALAFMTSGLNEDNLVRIMLAGFLLLQFMTYPLLVRLSKVLKPQLTFFVLALTFAAVVEGFHMMLRPVFGSLKISMSMGVAEMFRNYGIDLAFTLPVYLIVFAVIWWFIRRYRYEWWEYMLVMAAGQALGDGAFFFLSAPLMLLMIPYVMINYHAMNLVPFLLARDASGGNRSILRFVVPVLLVGIYLICGAAIALVGKTFFGMV